jgi:peptidoglycan LD-endopeptidase CwlK
MSDLRSITKDLQRELGLDPDEIDGVPGLVTIKAALAFVRAGRMDEHEEKEAPATSSATVELDARSEKIIASLDPNARPMFRQFLCRAKATAATLGCDYVLISGNRTYAEQDALYAQGRTKPGKVVTKARGGFSNHNFGIAVDAGVFQGKLYLDGGTKAQADLAAKVHKACSEHAAACGLEWGGSWSGFKDLPHFEIATGLSMAAKRKLFAQKGSVL